MLVRELTGDRAGKRKVSLRATDGRVDVSVIARALGGGGHRQAAGVHDRAADMDDADRARSAQRVRAQLAAA